MTVFDELQALVISIGEHSLNAIGRENVRALDLRLDPRTNEASMRIVLSDNSDPAQMQALQSLFEVELLFTDEAVLSFAFAQELDEQRATARAIPQFSYA